MSRSSDTPFAGWEVRLRGSHAVQHLGATFSDKLQSVLGCYLLRDRKDRQTTIPGGATGLGDGPRYGRTMPTLANNSLWMSSLLSTHIGEVNIELSSASHAWRCFSPHQTMIHDKKAVQQVFQKRRRQNITRDRGREMALNSIVLESNEAIGPASSPLPFCK